MKRSTVASGVAKSGTQSNMIVEQVRDLPGCRATKKSPTADGLAHFQSIPLVDSEIATNLRVEGRITKRLDARAIEKHIPMVKFPGGSDQCKSRASQLRSATLRVGEKERGQCVVRS